MLTFAVVTASGAAAADPPETQDAGAPADTVTAPTPVPIPEIPRHLEESRQLLRSFEAMLATAEPADSTLAVRVEGMRDGLDELLASPTASHPDLASGRAIRDLEGECLRRRTKLTDWARTLERDAGTLDARRAELGRSQEKWSLSRAELEEANLGSGLVAAVDSLLQYHESVRQQLDERYSGLLQLRTQITGQGERLDGLLASLTEAQQPGAWDLLRPERPPLWADVPEAQEKAAQVRGTWEDSIAPLPGFVADNIPNLVTHFLVFAGLLAVIVIARSRRQRWEEEGDTDSGAPSSVDRPVAAAMIGALLVSRILYPFAPTIVYVLIRAISVFPLVVLVPRILPERYVGLSWAVGTLYLIDTAEFLFLDDPTLHRLHLLVVALLGLIAAILVVRRGTGEPGEKERMARRWGGSIAALAFAASCVTNTYGAVELAGLCSDRVLQVLYLSVVAVVGERVLENVIGILLRIAPLRHLRSVRVHRALLERRLAAIARLLILFFWARGILALFGVERAFLDLLLAILGIGGTVGAITVTIGDFFAFFLTLWISIQVSRFLQFALAEDILPRVTLPRGVSQTITRLTHYAVVTLGFILAVAATGFELGKLAILAGGLGVGVGFGMQSIVNNFISGLILMFERPVQVGDTIEVGTLIGRVSNIGIRASTVRTYSGAEVVVPNANLVSNEVINWTLSDRRRRIEIPVGVAYGSDPEQVRQLLLEAAADHVDALDTPVPLAFFLGFGESALDFELRFWTNEFEEWQRVRGEVATQVQRMLADAGIEIPFPQRTVHVRTETPAPRPAPAADPKAPPSPDRAK